MEGTNMTAHETDRMAVDSSVAQDQHFSELIDLELACIGGGSGDVLVI
jgi:hypothetical protein